jgi:hypothetical protein
MALIFFKYVEGDQLQGQGATWQADSPLILRNSWAHVKNL